ncbi:MAG: His-Xaa-Ser system radical SAM maturase HxsC [Polyangiales bacterium]
MKLHARGLVPLAESSPTPFLGRVWSASEPAPEGHLRSRGILLAGDEDPLVEGFRAYFVRSRRPVAGLRDVYLLGADHDYVAPGDVLRVDPARRTLSAILRASSPSNSFLVTERCDNYCVMCSQPPKERDDAWLVDELLEAIPLMPRGVREVGITGGEPALLGPRLVDLIRTLGDHLPGTAVHVLTNGRRFAEPGFARSIAALAHPDLMFGVPLYADLPEDHDYVVQARGAFEETVRGIVALARAGLRVELRFVIHRETLGRIEDFARFVARNLTFVHHVALMGLEPVGFARANLDRLWADPVDYGEALRAATLTLHRAGLAVSLYNHPLCVLDTSLHPFSRRSISDWKNLYFEECDRCLQRDACGGFFESSRVRRSRGVAPFISPAMPPRGRSDHG